jgi:hypothetical protein
MSLKFIHRQLLDCQFIIFKYVHLGYSIPVDSASLYSLILNYILLLNNSKTSLEYYLLNFHIFAYANNYTRQDENQRVLNCFSYE